MITVSFKDEGTINGRVFGPVVVTNTEIFDRDPEVIKMREAGLPGLPLGYQPAGQDRVGWRSINQAREIARAYGVELTQY